MSDPSPTGSGATYSTPSPDRPPAGRLIVISGPSGVGKSSIVDRLTDMLPLRFSVSATTRAARPGERHGVDYYFVSRSRFEERIADGLLLEWAEYNDNLYGTPRRPVEAQLEAGHDVILDIEVQGARQVKAAYPAAVMVFIAPPTLDTLAERLGRRGDTSDEEIARRVAIARGELEAAESLFDHVVVNEDLDRAVDEVAGILRRPEED